MNSLWNLFRPKKSEQIPASTPIETVPVPEEQVEPVAQPELPMMPPQLIVGIAQSVGMQRDHNEDTLFALHSILADGTSDLPFGIFVVADGMGGHLNGEVASAAAARAFSQYLLHHFFMPFIAGDPRGEKESVHEIMENGMLEAQHAVLLNAPGGGTTLTAALILGSRVTLAHVGDSRAYFIHANGHVEVATQDHSLVRRLQDLGQIDEKEASVHPQRNVLYRALGQSGPFHPDISTSELPKHGYLLICSDGLWGSVPDEEILRIIQNAPTITQACQMLVQAANEAGGPDNISAILVQYQG